jgi:hypothetical protein
MKTKTSNFMKIRSVGAELFHADGGGQTGMKNLIITLCNFANTTKKQTQQYPAGNSYLTLLPCATISMAPLTGNRDNLPLSTQAFLVNSVTLSLSLKT